MKTIKYILLLTVALLVSNCDTNDDGFYNNVYANIPHLVTIDPHSANYTVGEKLYVSTDFSRYLNENGKTLDIYETTGATQFTFSYMIEKQVDTQTWNPVTVSDNQLDIVKGHVQNDFFLLGICEYNTTSEKYEYRVGFPLLAPGTYRMSFGYNSESYTSVELQSVSPATRLILNINSLLDGIDAAGYYNFTVN